MDAIACADAEVAARIARALVDELPELFAVEAAGRPPAYPGWIADNVGIAPLAHDSGE